ncbi:TetR/AcrR family transcriptional regulator [Streptomyces montanisoli]|uniref:TetR/AcrR family transcriptional regulator n=1 Tax=Streptomyces montanisoli TaxID=2798581 RepID=A0A940MC12_9ACTN|nr:TetR/AcrR family transcriptional regulator [Streptomyces montanisoli]MBP0460184.1 TetR/AcrR family transcriptional regulator [Streptomyces montanisoli]
MGRKRGFEIDEALGAAVDTFWERGFDATSVQTLCRAMELQPGSVYAAFGSKQELFTAALGRYVATVSAEAVERVNGAPSGMLGLRAYFAHLVDSMVDGKRRWGCLITNSLVELAGREPELTGLFQRHLANLETSFAAALTRARDDGELREGVGPKAAPLLVAVVQGMNVMAKGRPGRAALNAVADSALAGLAA